jgi:hypothetical protein
LVLLGFHIRQEVPKNCYLCSGGFQIMVQGELGGLAGKLINLGW